MFFNAKYKQLSQSIENVLQLDIGKAKEELSPTTSSREGYELHYSCNGYQ